MDSTDEEAVRRAIEQDRQSVSKAREAWQQSESLCLLNTLVGQFNFEYLLNNEFLSSNDLSKYIKESYNWNDEDIDNLIERYEDQIGLLQRYNAIHKQF